MKKQQCRYCPREITMVLTAKNQKWTPVELPGTIRHGSEPPEPGAYYDANGNFYAKADEVPCKVEVFRSHWGECPGRDAARKK
jgi:hypothetical protein